MQTGRSYAKVAGSLMSRINDAAEQGIDGLLQQVPPDCLEALNAFYRRHEPIKLRALGGLIEIEPAFGRKQRRQPLLRVEIAVDGDTGTLFLPATFADLIFLELDGSPNIADFDPEQAAILMELALRGMLEAIEAGIGGKISVISVASRTEEFEPLPEPSFDFGLSVARLGLLHVHLHLPANPSLRLADYLAARTAKRNEETVELAALTFPVCIRLGASVFSQAGLRELAAGDVILLDGKSSVLPGAALIIGETLAARLEIAGSNATLMGAPAIAFGTVLEGLTVRGIESWFQDGLDQDADGIPVIVTFELCKYHVSLEDLRLFRRGTAVPLGSHGMDLEIAANGQMIGLGKLITIGDSTGVMVTRLVQRRSALSGG
jgi:flagellar motor switch/type III secretory pathway protein FliN